MTTLAEVNREFDKMIDYNQGAIAALLGLKYEQKSPAYRRGYSWGLELGFSLTAGAKADFVTLLKQQIERMEKQKTITL